jgi:hypothetical protein
MRIGRGNRSNLRKPSLVPLCPPRIPHDSGSNPSRRCEKPASNLLSCNLSSELSVQRVETQTEDRVGIVPAGQARRIALKKCVLIVWACFKVFQ